MRRAQSNPEAAPEAPPVAPTVRALEYLDAAAQAAPDDGALVIEERAVWQPDSWLLQRCWHALAEAGAGQEALQVAAHLETRTPLARVQALYHIARHLAQNQATLTGTDTGAEAARRVAQEVRQTTVTLFRAGADEAVFKFGEQLLYAGAAAAQLGNIPLACACLERLDQLAHPWDRLFIPMESRSVLAETVVQIGLHPLANALLEMAIRRYEEPGAQFLHQIMQSVAARLKTLPPIQTGPASPRGRPGPTQFRAHVRAQRTARRSARLMQRCVEVFQFSTLATLTTRRLAATAFGQAGLVPAVLEQVETIATVQAARQETGHSGSRGDPHFLRQVKRPTANLDVDFQLYTLQEAIKAMPLRKIAREERIELADRVAALATQSDGWTAAGAVATLVDLGALRYAVSVMDFIPPSDSTRSEGMISLVRALLAFGDAKLAHEQVQKAIAWAQSLPGRNPERALIWGLAEVYMEFEQPQRAIELLDLRVARAEAEAGIGQRVRRLLRNAPNDDQLRDNRLRLRALVLQNRRQAPAIPPTATAVTAAATATAAATSGPTDALDEAADTASAANDQENDPEPDTQHTDSGETQPDTWTREQDALYRQLRLWAPRLLEGEALVNFYVDGLLRPLFLAGQTELILQLLPQIGDALHSSTGDKHTVHVRKIATLLAQALDSDAGTDLDSGPVTHAVPHTDRTALRTAFVDFLFDLWAGDAPRGIWQMVHSLEGSLPLLLALEGPQALVTIANHTAENGPNWSAST